MELSFQLHGLGAALNLGWVPREQNVEADALTSEDVSAFDAAKRVRVIPEELGFQVIPRLMTAAGAGRRDSAGEREAAARAEENQARGWQLAVHGPLVAYVREPSFAVRVLLCCLSCV